MEKPRDPPEAGTNMLHPTSGMEREGHQCEVFNCWQGRS